MTATKNIKGF